MFAVRRWWLAPFLVMLSPRAPAGSATLLAQAPPVMRATALDPTLALDVNIPAFRLEVYEGGRVTRTYGVAVGMRRYETPRGAFAVTRIEWNPWWIPPASPWAAKERPTPPGPANPMGKVKLYFRPMYFLHGTPFESSIGSAASHGCVRLAERDAVALAKLVHRYGSPELDSISLQRMIDDSTETQIVELRYEVPVTLRYDLVELRGRRLSVYRDVYGLAKRPVRSELFAVLADAGVDTTRVLPRRVAALLASARRRSTSIALDSLLER